MIRQVLTGFSVLSVVSACNTQLKPQGQSEVRSVEIAKQGAMDGDLHVLALPGKLDMVDIDKEIDKMPTSNLLVAGAANYLDASKTYVVAAFLVKNNKITAKSITGKNCQPIEVPADPVNKSPVKLNLKICALDPSALPPASASSSENPDTKVGVDVISE